MYSIEQPVNDNVETPLSKRKCSDSYEMVQVLGEGQYGMVTKARKKSDGKPVAIKKIKMAWAEKYNEGFPVTTIREIEILISERCSHPSFEPNVVSLLDIVLADEKYDKQDSKEWKDAICLVFEYLDYDFGALIANPTTIMTMDHVRCYMKQILNALVFAEERNIMHRDLKPANLLLSKDSHTIKFADWGMARKELNETKVETLITVRVIDGCFWLTRGPWHENNPIAVPRLPLRLLCPASYEFDQSHPSNVGYPLLLSSNKNDGSNSDRPIYNNGEVVRSDKPLGTPGAGFKFFYKHKDSQIFILLLSQRKKYGGSNFCKEPVHCGGCKFMLACSGIAAARKVAEGKKEGIVQHQVRFVGRRVHHGRDASEVVDQFCPAPLK